MLVKERKPHPDQQFTFLLETRQTVREQKMQYVLHPALDWQPLTLSARFGAGSTRVAYLKALV
jgi:hypothetical protein